MIIKILTRKNQSFKDLLEYITDEKKWKLYDNERHTFTVTHNLRGNTIPQWVQQYKANEAYRKVKRTDSIYIYHEILSWHEQDQQHLTLDKMQDMTKEYLRLRNPNGIFFSAPHFDKGNYHVHICASGIEYKTGKSLRLTKSALDKLKKDIQNYQIEKYPELTRSIVEHGKAKQKRVTDGEYRHKQRTGKLTDKEQILEILNSCHNQAGSKEDFFILLKDHGLVAYTRSGKLSAIYNKRKYRLGRLGFNEEKLYDLENQKDRTNQLKQIRKTKRYDNIQQSR